MATLRTPEPRLMRLRSLAILAAVLEILAAALAITVAGTTSSWNLLAFGSTGTHTAAPQNPGRARDSRRAAAVAPEVPAPVSYDRPAPRDDD